MAKRVIILLCLITALASAAGSVRPRSIGVATALCAVLPGSGYFYAGEPRTGLVFLGLEVPFLGLTAGSFAIAANAREDSIRTLFNILGASFAAGTAIIHVAQTILVHDAVVAGNYRRQFLTPDIGYRPDGRIQLGLRGRF